jgi:predicted ArsR family transcriptional regulator
VFGRSTGNRHADALLRILRDGPLGREAAKRELGIRTAADRQDAIDLLRQIGAVETVRVARAGGGRPAEVLRLAGVTTHTTQTLQGPAQERGPGDA